MNNSLMNDVMTNDITKRNLLKRHENIIINNEIYNMMREDKISHRRELSMFEIVSFEGKNCKDSILMERSAIENLRKKVMIINN